MTVKSSISISTFVMLLFYILFWNFIEDDYAYNYFAPSVSNIALLTIIACLTLVTRSDLGRVFVFTWFSWPIIGTFFSLGHYYQHKLRAPIYTQEPTDIFMLNAIALLVPFVVLERQWVKPPVGKSQSINIDWSFYFKAAIVIFPVPYAISLALSGHTILSGSNITDQIYSTDRGALYLFRTILPISCVFLCVEFLKLKGLVRWPIILYICFILFASALDGKRDMLLVSSISVLATILIFRPTKSATFVVLGTIFLIGAYGAISQIRAGAEKVGFDGALGLSTIAGIEYRDYAYSINYWSRADIASYGYDWTESTVASVLNRQILSAFGVDKDEWVKKDSARSWMRAFNLDDGIRIGLPGELHYAFGHWSFLVSAIIGSLIALLLKNIVRTSSSINFAFLVVVWAFVAFLPFSQTTAVVGAFPTIFYIYIIALITAKSKQQAGALQAI